MIDREQLQRAFRRIRQSCYSLIASPLLLGFVAWTVSREAATSPTAPGSGNIALPLLVAMGILALSPLLSVPLARAALRRTFNQPDHPDAERRLQALLPAETYMSCGLWAVATLAGFVAVFAGAAWWFYVCAVAITYGGLFVHFPRWSRWVERAQEIEQAVAGRPIPTSL